MCSPADFPHQQRRPRLCLIGDSHLASVRRAVDCGLLNLGGYETEFWGADGPHYRDMVLRRGRLAVKTDTARERFQKINGQARDQVGPDDFDLIVFYGARVRTCYFFGPLLQRQYGGCLSLSTAALEAAARVFMTSSKFYRFAVAFARKGRTQVHVVTDPLLTADVVDHREAGHFLDLWPQSVEATAADRARIWSAFERVAAADGVTFVSQPDETVTQGVFTHARYGVENAIETADFGHKSPEFAALMLRNLEIGAAPARQTVTEAKSPLLRAVG